MQSPTRTLTYLTRHWVDRQLDQNIEFGIITFEFLAAQTLYKRNIVVPFKPEESNQNVTNQVIFKLRSF